jgi:hypothetical protein
MSCNVRNLNGQIVHTLAIQDYAKNTTVLNLSKLANGLYLVELSSDAGQILFKEKINIVK